MIAGQYAYDHLQRSHIVKLSDPTITLCGATLNHKWKLGGTVSHSEGVKCWACKKMMET